MFQLAPYSLIRQLTMSDLKLSLEWRRWIIVCMLFALVPACNANGQGTAAFEKLALLPQLSKAGKYDEVAKIAKEAAELAPKDAGVQQRAGEFMFLAGKAAESIPLFDRANELDPRLSALNWQRGVALGCVGRFEEGAEQFRIHHEVNPDDVENSAWYYLCVAKTKGKEAAEKSLIPSRGDARQPMMSILKMLHGRLKPEEVLEAAKSNTADGPERKMALFYGFLYVGLYHDSIGESEKAVTALEQSIAHADDDYMGRTARIYRELRFAKSLTKSAEPTPKP